MASSPNFDVAVGMHESVINAMVKEIYNAIYSVLLKGNIKVDKMGISSVNYDFQSSPVLSLEQSGHAIEKIKSSLETAYFASVQGQSSSKTKSQSSALVSEMLAVVSSATFSLEVSKIALTVNYLNKKKTSFIASLEAHATISVEDSSLAPTILAGTINIPGDPVLTQLINNAFIPELISYLNDNVCKPIKIPPLEYGSLQVSTPIPTVQNSYFTAFSALGSTPPKIPSPISWPTDGIYIAADSALFEAAAGTIFPLGPQQNFDWTVFSGHVGATVNVPKLSSVNNDGSINAKIEVNASCQLSVDTHIPFVGRVSFGPSATASVAGTFRAYVKDGDVKLRPEGIPIPNFSFNWGFPSSINWFFDPLEEGLAVALNAALGPLIANALAIPGFKVYHIPEINIPFSKELNVKITIDDVTPSGMNSEMILVDSKITVSS